MSGGFDNGFSISPLAGGGGGGVPLNFSQTKGVQVTITALEAKPATVVSTTITTQGNPVQIIVAGDANPTAGGWGLLNIYRDGTAVGQLVQFESSDPNENVPYCLQVVDEPAAGTWTYSLKVTSITTDTQFGEAAGPIITVTELGAESGGGGGGGGSPGGSDGDIQYRVNATTFGGTSKIRFDGSDVFVTGSFLGNLVGTASYATNAGNALTASYAANAEFTWQQAIFVAKNGNDVTADGTLNSPFLTISGAMASISDASPTKRYVVNVHPGEYTEGTFSLKANVFINGYERNAVRIIATSFVMNNDFSGLADNRSGFANCILIGVGTYNWTTVTSGAGKLYFTNCLFNSNVSFTGYNNSIAQIATSNCVFFGTWTISGISAGTHQGNIHYSSVSLNQHPTLPTLLNANGGGAGSTTVTTTVNNFGRRCACFFYSFWAGTLTIDGPSSYVDATQSSLDTAGPTTLNGGTFVSIGNVVNATLSNLTNPTSINANLVPNATNSRYNGDFGSQWLFNLAYVHGTTGTEMYLITMPSVFGSSDTGRDIWVLPDGYGLDANVNGGNIILETAAVSGTGIRGAIILNARQIDVSGSLVRNLATPLTGSDAATAKYADVFPTGSTGSRSSGPVTGQRFFDTTLGLPIWWNGTAWINAAGTIV